MRFAFVNPDWDFRGSTYFGCKEEHLPLELMFAFDKVREAGHEPLLVDAQVEKLTIEETKRRVNGFAPDFLVIPTAPSYLFWRCPPPELRMPREWIAGIGSKAKSVVIGPHTSVTPVAVMHKTNCDIAFRGEPDELIVMLASEPWERIEGCCFRKEDGSFFVSATLGVTNMRSLRALDFKNYNLEMHGHRHHVFSGEGRGAELECPRGCPWNCTFCNKTLFRNKFRERDVDQVLLEIDRLIERGTDYIYFIDEIFGVG